MAKTMCEPRLHPGLGKISHKKHLENNWRNLVDCINGDLMEIIFQNNGSVWENARFGKPNARVSKNKIPMAAASFQLDWQ